MAKLKVKSDAKNKVKKEKKSTNDDANDTSNDAGNTEDVTMKTKKEKKGKYEKVTTNVSKENYKKDKHSKDAKGKGKTLHKNFTQGNSTEKPDWVQLKKEKKELKEKYKAKKLNDIYDISIMAKQIGEKLRRSDCTPLERKKLILKAHDLLQSHYNKIILTHDMSRIVQWMVKYSDSEIRQAIFNELKPSLLSMIQSKYAKNCVKNMLKYGTQEMKKGIKSACYGNIVKFMSSSVTAPLVELIYSTYAAEIEKIYFKQEFYGDMYKQAKEKDVKSLSDVFKSAENMKSATLSAVKGNLMRILNKKLLNYTLVQCVLLEFLEQCSVEDRTEIIVMCRGSAVELSHTKPGAKIVTQCIWHGTNKDRKIIMKTLKENVKTVCMSEHGYLILLALFDSVDDTVLMKKIIISEIEKDLMDIALNEHGKHVILYLVARRNPLYFPPSIVKYLEQGDNNESSKKLASIREKELMDTISSSLLENVAKNTATWMSNSSIAMVTLAILKVGTGEQLKQAFDSLAKFITDSKTKLKEGDSERDLVDHGGLHMMLKKLIQNDKLLHVKENITFGEILVNHLTIKTIKKWIEYNRGCFLLVLLLENESQLVVDTLRDKLREMKDSLKSKSTSGATILLKKLN
ncbi:pumilio and CPL domain-containing protein penguin [Calliopsis andreniformis]|uniref:pumilio and CPL domain-containing protein penguin n=1 Tax=Calliopsis andreniformis TaxID=337506 RepID=UPI003FCD4A75